MRPLSLLLLLSLGVACRTGPKSSANADERGWTAEDTDRDGFTADEDCDDQDPTAGPGLEELCDGVDNDCDGDIDEGLTTAWWPDEDGDGYGDEAAAVAPSSRAM